MSGTIAMASGRADDRWLFFAVQRNNRRRTIRQIAYIQRRLDHEVLDMDQRSRLEAELADLRTRFR